MLNTGNTVNKKDMTGLIPTFMSLVWEGQQTLNPESMSSPTLDGQRRYSDRVGTSRVLGGFRATQLERPLGEPSLTPFHISCLSRLTGREKRVGGFDLMWSDGPVSREKRGSDLSGIETL